MQANRVFINHSCAYFPCHKLPTDKWISCNMCYCPLYLLKCEGNYTEIVHGLKDCTNCTLPHESVGQEYIIEELEKQLL